MASAPAAAQAPGEVQPVAPSVMDRPWSIGLGFGSIGLRPDRDGADKSSSSCSSSPGNTLGGVFYF